jgi:predicted nucleotidyltransferase
MARWWRTKSPKQTMAISNKAELFKAFLKHRARLEQFGVKRCGVFGSFARGMQSNQSDVDILVEFEPGKKSFDNFMGLAFFLEETIGRRVELVTPEALSPYIGPHILREVEYASTSE